MTEDDLKRIAQQHGPAVLVGAAAGVLAQGAWALGKAVFGSRPAANNTVPVLDLSRQGLAAVYIFDPGGRMHSFIGAVDVYCDGMKVADLGTGKYIQLLLVPGEHTFRSIRKAPVAMTLEPGKQYYLELYFSSVFSNAALRVSTARLMKDSKLVPVPASKIYSSKAVCYVS